MHVCCILHNMLLKHDGLDKRWEHGRVDPFHDGEGNLDVNDMNVVFARLREFAEVHHLNLTLDENTDLTKVRPIAPIEEGEEEAEELPGHFELREVLIQHLNSLWLRRQLVWPSRNRVTEDEE